MMHTTEATRDSDGIDSAADAEIARMLAALRDRYRIEGGGPGAVTLVAELTVEGRRVDQPVELCVHAGPMSPWLVVTAYAGAAHDAPAYELLAYNATMAFGAVCVIDGAYVVRYAAPAEGAETAIARVVDALAQEAAQLRLPVTLPGADVTSGVFGHYSE